jgi:hypothetical protein
MSRTSRSALSVVLLALVIPAIPVSTSAQLKQFTSPTSYQRLPTQPTSLQTVVHTSIAGPRRFVYTYRPDGLRETERVQRLTSGTWVDSVRTTWTFTSTGKFISEYVEQYLLGAFRSMSRWSVEYNDAGDLVSSLSERGNWVLEPVGRSLFTYVSPGKMATEIAQSWSGGWSNTARSSYTWNTMGQETGSVYEQWIGGKWDTTRVTEISHSSGALHEETYRTRSKGDGSWRDSSWAHLVMDDARTIRFAEQKSWSNGMLTWAERITGSFDLQGRITRSETEMLIQGTLTPIRRVTYTYDASGNLLERVADAYDAGLWHPTWKCTSSYDGSGNILTSKSYAWGSEAWIPSTGAENLVVDMALSITDASGNFKQFVHFSALTFSYGNDPTDVPIDPAGLPRNWELAQNFPNPFNPSTTIRYALPERSHVTLKVYDALGQQVAILVNGEKPQGYHEVTFEARNLPTGVYFYRMQAGSYTETKKLLLAR